jgi:hypothetical protein
MSEPNSLKNSLLSIFLLRCRSRSDVQHHNKEISPTSFEVSEIECDVASKLLILSLRLSDKGSELGLRCGALGFGEIAAPKLAAQLVDLIESGHVDRLLLITSTGRRAHEARVKEREATASGGEWGAGFVGAQGTGAEAKSGAHTRP